MRKSLRTALIWMLMLALPAQAMAALGMQLCEQVHRSGALQMSGSEHGEHHDMTADSAHDAHQDGAPAASSEAPGDGSLCTLCAFCVGVAAPSQPFLNDSALQAVEPATAWPDRLIVGVADTPERPPRLSLA
jgi:ferredoxin